VVEKAARRMLLMRQGATLKSYRISLGRSPIGHKQQEGDSRTPEGIYTIDARNPQSRFHLSLRVSYPNAADRRSAAARGVSPGGDIFIHGLPNGADLASLFAGRDWTDGCIAVSNAEIREIWAMVKDGTPIEIRP
jgi:murein L,D-transpeptidase YafK